MTRAPRPSHPDDATFEPDEHPTRPAPPPEEHLRRLRRSVWPARARLGARRRPALSATTEVWLAQQGSARPRTATSRFRAVAAAVLGGGSGRASRVDHAELAPVPDPPSTPVEAEAPPPPPTSPTATARMPAHVARPIAPTLKLRPRDAAPSSGDPSSSARRDSSAFDFGQARRRLARRVVVACSVLLFSGWSAWFVLRAPPAPAPLPVSQPATAVGVDPGTAASSEALPPTPVAEPAPSHDHAGQTVPRRHVRGPSGPGRASTVF
ncbi:MAG TPA: hypothetical protein VIF09_25525 [Polyangiaceae bacterium]|jgi:hypothetical protein